MAPFLGSKTPCAFLESPSQSSELQMQEEGAEIELFGVRVTYIYLARLEISQKQKQNGRNTDCNQTHFLKKP